MKESRKRYSKDFKNKIIDLYLSKTLTTSEIAKKFAINVNDIYRWTKAKQDRELKLAEKFVKDNGEQPNFQAVMQENLDLKEQVFILKKALSILCSS